MTLQELQHITTKLDNWRLFFQGRLCKPRAAMVSLNAALAKNEKDQIVAAVEQVQHELKQAAARGEISDVGLPTFKNVSPWKAAENLRFTVSGWQSNLQTRVNYPETLRKGLVSAFERGDNERIDDLLMKIEAEFTKAIERAEIQK